MLNHRIARRRRHAVHGSAAAVEAAADPPAPHGALPFSVALFWADTGTSLDHGSRISLENPARAGDRNPTAGGGEASAPATAQAKISISDPLEETGEGSRHRGRLPWGGGLSPPAGRWGRSALAAGRTALSGSSSPGRFAAAAPSGRCRSQGTGGYLTGMFIRIPAAITSSFPVWRLDIRSSKFCAGPAYFLSN